MAASGGTREWGYDFPLPLAAARRGREKTSARRGFTSSVHRGEPIEYQAPQGNKKKKKKNLQFSRQAHLSNDAQKDLCKMPHLR